LNRHAKQVISKNWAALGCLARVAITCARQDIALRGHSEHGEPTENVNRGNFLALVELVKFESSSTKANLDCLPKNASYCGKNAQNELLHAAADVVTAKIVSEVKMAGMYTVITDEARDSSKTEQLSICVRYVLEHEIKDRFLTFVALKQDL